MTRLRPGGQDEAQGAIPLICRILEWVAVAGLLSAVLGAAGPGDRHPCLSWSWRRGWLAWHRPREMRVQRCDRGSETELVRGTQRQILVTAEFELMIGSSFLEIFLVKIQVQMGP